MVVTQFEITPLIDTKENHTIWFYSYDVFVDFCRQVIPLAGQDYIVNIYSRGHFDADVPRISLRLDKVVLFTTSSSQVNRENINDESDFPEQWFEIISQKPEETLRN